MTKENQTELPNVLYAWQAYGENHWSDEKPEFRETRPVEYVRTEFVAFGGDSAPVAAQPVVSRPLKKKRVPREHTENEDCNCEYRGFSLGWNAAIDLLKAAAKETT